MGLFGSSKPRVSEREFKQNVRSLLNARGFTERQLQEVAMIFRGDLDETLDSQKGIDADEIARGIAWMRAHMSYHSIPERKIALLEDALREEL